MVVFVGWMSGEQSAIAAGRSAHTRLRGWAELSLEIAAGYLGTEKSFLILEIPCSVWSS